MTLRPSSRIVRCTILRTADEDPLLLVRDLVEASGARIRRVDSEGQRLAGTIGPTTHPPSCKVTVRLYPREGVSLVETILESSWRRRGKAILAECAERLRWALEGARIAGHQVAEWTKDRGSSR